MNSQKNSAIEQVILLIHGIRTQADWQDMVAKILEEENRIKVIPIKYGYFDVFRFWFPFSTRSKPIHHVEDQIRIAKDLYPNAKLSIIVHSFGSYIIGKIFERKFDLNIEKLILCGSVLKADYPWEEALKRRNISEESVINECGKRDIWPVLAQVISWGYGVSGTHGFGNVIVKDRFHDVTHGQYFKEEFVNEYWKPFIHNGEYKRTKFEIIRPSTPWWLSLLGIFPAKSILALIVLYFIIPPIIPKQQCIEDFPPIVQYETTPSEAPLKNALTTLTKGYIELIAMGDIKGKINFDYSKEIKLQGIYNQKIRWNRSIDSPRKLCDHLLEIRRLFNEQSTHQIDIYISCDTIRVVNSQEAIPEGYKVCR